MNYVIPSNGTQEWPIGTDTEDYTEKRRGGAITGIAALCVLVFVAFVVLVVFCKLHKDGTGHHEANEIAFKEQEHETLVNPSNKHTDEGHHHSDHVDVVHHESHHSHHSHHEDSHL